MNVLARLVSWVRGVLIVVDVIIWGWGSLPIGLFRKVLGNRSGIGPGGKNVIASLDCLKLRYVNNSESSQRASKIGEYGS